MANPSNSPLPPGTIKKVPATDVPYGADICRIGHSVWVAYHEGALIIVAATSKEATRRYRAWLSKHQAERCRARREAEAKRRLQES